MEAQTCRSLDACPFHDARQLLLERVVEWMLEQDTPATETIGSLVALLHLQRSPMVR
jgi:hypothetical protein